MRILIPTLAKKTWIGGVPTYLRILERSLSQQFMDVHILDDAGEMMVSSLWYRKLCHLLSVYSFGNVGILILMSAAQQISEIAVAEANKYDLIHAQDPFVALKIRERLPRSKIVLTAHGLDSEHLLENCTTNREGAKPLLKEIFYYHSLIHRQVCEHERAGFLSADHVISVDSGYACKVIDMGVPKSRVTVVFNAVDSKKLHELSRQHCLPFLSECPYFLMVRRLYPKNGPQFALRAFLAWVADKNVRLVIAGDGDLRGQLERECATHPQGNKVIFLGTMLHEAVPSLIARSIATLVPSVPVGGVVEATSFSALESLALGVPVIASDIGGLTDIDGGSGTMNLLPPGSVRHIVDELEDLYRQFMAGKIDKEKKRHHIQEHFDTDQWASKIIKVYEAALIGQRV